MPVTDYPELTRIRKELNLLQKLYSLYNTVMDSVDGYYDILWVEVSENLVFHILPLLYFYKKISHLDSIKHFL